MKKTLCIGLFSITLFTLVSSVYALTAEESYQAGAAYFKRGLYDLCIIRENNAISIDPKIWQAYEMKGDAYTQEGNSQAALDAYRLSLKINPDNSRLKAIVEGTQTTNNDQIDVASETNPKPSPMAVTDSKPMAVENFSPDHLKGTWALGYDYFNILGSTITARKWIENDLALDLMLGGNFSPGYSYSGTSYSTGTSWNFGVGVGLRQNIARPIQDVYIQWLFLLSYSQTFLPLENGLIGVSIYNDQSQTLNLFIGPGFEAFLPFLPNLSVEANLGLNITSYWIENNSGYYQNGWNWKVSLGSDSNTFSLFNAAVHFYF